MIFLVIILGSAFINHLFSLIVFLYSFVVLFFQLCVVLNFPFDFCRYIT